MARTELVGFLNKWVQKQNSTVKPRFSLIILDAGNIKKNCKWIPGLQGLTGTVISICLSVSQSSRSSFSPFREFLCSFAVIIHFLHSKEKQCNMKFPSQFISKMALNTKLSVQILVCGKARRYFFPQQFSLIKFNVVMWFLNGPMTSGKPSAKWSINDECKLSTSKMI